MLKRKLIQKIMITSIALFTLFLIYIIPSGKTEVTISENVDDIGDTLLQSQKSLTTLIVDENNQHFKESNGVLYNYDFTKMIAVCGGIKTVEANENVKEIGKSCCFSCTNLISFSFKTTGSGFMCTTINESAFYSSK